MGQIDFNKVWQNFMDMVQNHYMDFSGRLGQAQFWFFILVCGAIQVVAQVFDGIATYGLISGVIGLALLLPTAGAVARRMQDGGNNGQLAWALVLVWGVYAVMRLMLGLAPFGMFGVFGFFYFFYTIGWLIQLGLAVVIVGIIYFCIQPGQAGDNQYGPPPPVWTPGPS